LLVLPLNNFLIFSLYMSVARNGIYKTAPRCVFCLLGDIGEIALLAPFCIFCLLGAIGKTGHSGDLKPLFSLYFTNFHTLFYIALPVSIFHTTISNLFSRFSLFLRHIVNVAEVRPMTMYAI
jgi:hypothetical protein